MRHSPNWYAAAFLLMAVPATSAAQGSSAQPGQWQVTHMTKGVPMGDKQRKATVCLTAKQLVHPVQAFRDAIWDVSKDIPRCTVKNFSQDGEQLTWQASCEHPRNKDSVAGKGSGKIGRDSFDGTQLMSISMALFKIDLTEIIKATYQGACP